MTNNHRPNLPDLDKATNEELREISDEVVRKLVERARTARQGRVDAGGHDSVYHEKS